MMISLEPSLLVQRQKARLTAAADGSFIMVDGASKGTQAVDFPHPDLARAVLRLRVELRPFDGARTDFWLLRRDGKLLARFGRDGSLHAAADPDLLDG